MSREYICNHIDRILTSQNLTLDQFQTELKKVGIEPDLYEPKGKWSGISYTFDSIKWSGSKLGSDYTPSGLLQRGVKNEAIEDAAAERKYQGNDDNRQALQTRAPAASTPDQNPFSKIKFAPGENVSEFTKVCCVLANLALELGAIVFEAVRNFFRWLMKKLGFGDGASDLKSYATTPQPPG